MKLALGTVQFGLDYGISNENGQVSLDEAKAIVGYAHQAGISTVDTAYLYGESEKVLGQILTDYPSETFQVITKLPGIPHNEITDDIITNINDYFTQSLKRLKKSSIEGLLLHSVKDLFLKGNHLLKNYLLQLKESQQVNKIGISVYSPDEVEQVLNFSDIKVDIVQLPLNIWDQRFLRTGWISTLHQHNIEVHTRSVFLQGTLLLSFEKFEKKFPQFVYYFKKYSDFLKKHTIYPLDFHLGFIHSIKTISKTVVGVTSAKELDEIITAYHRPNIRVDFEEFYCDELNLIDPRTWK